MNLFVGIYPGGTVICDKSVTVNNDYKELAFVRAYGQIHYKVDKDRLPQDVIERIETESRNYKQKFEEDTRHAWEIDRINTYGRLLDYLSIADFRAVTKETDSDRKLDLIIEAYERPYDYETTA